MKVLFIGSRLYDDVAYHVDKLGIEIIQSKGEISDEKLKEQLKTIQSNMS